MCDKESTGVDKLKKPAEQAFYQLVIVCAISGSARNDDTCDASHRGDARPGEL